jgi:hypothetical protein
MCKNLLALRWREAASPLLRSRLLWLRVIEWNTAANEGYRQTGSNRLK